MHEQADCDRCPRAAEGRFSGWRSALQHLFAMFGATILVPVTDRFNPAVALLSSGIGTLTYLDRDPGKNPGLSGFLLRLHRSDHQLCPGRRGRGGARSDVFWPVWFTGRSRS